MSADQAPAAGGGIAEGHEVCSGCKKEVDPDTCHCGDPEKGHGWGYNHPFIPMGCDCYRDAGDQR